MKLLLSVCYKLTNWFFILFVISLFSPYAFGKKDVLDLGEIEIKGEVRRPNINLIYSKKYMSKTMILMARQELKELEKELLEPAKNQIKSKASADEKGNK